MSEVKPVSWATALALLGVKNAEDGRRPRAVLLSRECAGGRRIGLILDADHERIANENASNRLRAERAEARVAELEREVAAKQARIDALMLEYCPDEMTPEQVAEWARHQRPANPTIVHCDNRGCDWVDNGINPIGCPYCKTTSGSINTSANHVRQA